MTSLDAIAVSHFDTDHWEGLTAFGAMTRPGLDSLKVYVPHLPAKLAGTGAAFVTTRSSDGTITSMLRTDLLPLMAPGRFPDIMPVARGDHATVGGVRMDVLWPPEKLPESDLLAIRNAVADVKELAGTLAHHGAPGLRKSLEGLTGEDLDDEPIGETGGEAGDALLREPDADETAPRTVFGKHVLRGLDKKLDRAAVEKEVKRVFTRVRAMNNDLSVILLTEDDSALLLGDASGRVVDRALAPVLGRLTQVRVMLAPHHGSQPLPKRLPDAALCIAQAGLSHAPGWEKHHRGKHGVSGCVCLHGLDGLTARW
ncbi:hypothetical protein [Actinoplanes sp. NPDC051494]|uniref:hypothetical protein n=1 Tax=Actinoplanes sp. NPDC051494 TaxID=3363907 RepID=UPI003791DB7D